MSPCWQWRGGVVFVDERRERKVRMSRTLDPRHAPAQESVVLWWRQSTGGDDVTGRGRVRSSRLKRLSHQVCLLSLRWRRPRWPKLRRTGVRAPPGNHGGPHLPPAAKTSTMSSDVIRDFCWLQLHCNHGISRCAPGHSMSTYPKPSAGV